MTLRVLLVDDEALARSRLRRLLADCREPAALVAAEADSAPQAMTLVQHETFDLVLLDIEMPGASGLQLASSWHRAGRAPLVIFVTAHAEHALQAFEVEAVDYLTKPVRLERLQAALRKAERMLEQHGDPEQAGETDEWLIISERGQLRRVALADVVYLKAEDKYVTVRTPGASYLLDDSLNQLEERHADRFIRVHRNALVAHSAVHSLVRARQTDGSEGWAVRLHGVEESLPVSRRQLAAVRAALAG